MRKISVAPRFKDFTDQIVNVLNEWFREATDRFGLYSKAGTPSTEVPVDNWGLWKNSSTGSLSLVANDSGTIKSVPLYSTPVVKPQLATGVVSGSQSVASGVGTKVTNLAVSLNPDGIYNTISNKIIPTVPGYYLVHAQVCFDFTGIAAISLAQCIIGKNGSFVATNSMVCPVVNASFFPAVTNVFQMNGTTDFFELYAFQNTGGAKNVLATDSFMDVVLVRPL